MLRVSRTSLAWLLLALSAAPSSLAAQRPVSPPPGGPIRASAVRARSPTTARIIGIIPGAGHVYAGEPKRGLAFFGGTVAVVTLGTLMLAADCLPDAGSGDDCTDTSTDVLVAAATLGVWGWSIYDAGKAAQRTNAGRSIRMTSRLLPSIGTPRLSVMAMVR